MMKTRFSIVVMLSILLPYATVIGQISSNWETLLNGTGDFGDKLNAVVADKNNNLYAAGYTVSPNTDRDFLIVKYDAQAKVLWRKIFAAPGNGPDEAKKIVLHPGGNIVVTGYGNNKSVGNDFWTIMLNPSGDTVWSRLYNSPTTNLYDEPNGIAIDGQGNIIITGESDQDPSAFLNNDFLTIKYNSAGLLQWEVRENLPANNNDRALAVTTDATNNIYITGRSFNGNDDDYVTIKYNPDGIKQWQKSYNGVGTDRPVSIGVDNASNVYVTGRSSNGTNDDYRTIKYDASGTQLFNVIYDVSGHDRPVEMVVLPSGGCIVTGRSDGNPAAGINYDIRTVSYSATGTRLWVAIYAGAAGNDDVPVGLSVTADGKALVTGFTDRDNTVNVSKDLVLLQYSNTGAELIKQTFNGTANKDDEGEGVAISPNGNIAVVGFTAESNNQHNALLLIYNGNTAPLAQNIWSGLGDNGENIRALTADASGNLFFCGYSVRQDNNRDFYYGKLNAAGVLQWSKDTTGSLYGSDEEANAIALDGGGNVYVSGFLKNSGTSSDVYLEKLTNQGTRIWNFRYDAPTSESDRALDMVLDNTGNAYLCGKTDIDTSWQVNDELLVMKVSNAGQLLWTATYAAPSSLLDKAQIVRLNNANEVIVAGVLQNGTNDNIIVIKYSNTGVQHWVKVLDFRGANDRLNDMILDNAGNILLTGQSQLNSGSSDYDAYICMVNAAGQQDWIRFIQNGGNGQDEGIALSLASDNSIWLTGHIDADAGTNENLDVFLMHYDAKGNSLQNSPTFYQTASDDVADDLVMINNVEPCLAIHTNTATGSDVDYAMRLLMLNSNALTLAYQRNISDTIDVANSLLWNNNLNALYVGGSSWSAAAQRDALLGKYTVIPTGINEIAPARISVFPNPAADYFVVQGKFGSDVSLKAWDQSGKLIHQETWLRGDSQKQVDCKKWLPGSYIITLAGTKGMQSFQIIKN
ncbi:MAG: T9SS type A sorting domain-containing protein [Bacteroidetes bacterium]|nr:T9SS type A sorting domain-containing protein [Bacteroidota bacterium]